MRISPDFRVWRARRADRRGLTFRRRPILGLVLLLVAGHSGCASHRLPSERVKGQLGTIGVVSGEVPKVDLQAPSQGKCALATAGAMGAALGPAAPLILLGVVIGGLAGAHEAASLPPADVTRDAETAIRRALDHPETDLGVLTMLRENVVKAGGERTRYFFTDLEGQILPTHRAGSDGLDHTWSDASLEVGVELSLRCVCGRCPLALEAPVRLVHTPDGRELAESTIEYAGNEYRSFTEWAANDAALLRAELKLATERTAAAIVEELFVLYEVP